MPTGRPPKVGVAKYRADRGDQTWYASFRYTAPDGTRKRCRAPLHTTSKSEAMQRAMALFSELHHEPDPDRPPPEPAPELKAAAFSGFARYWLDVVQGPRKSPRKLPHHKSPVKGKADAAAARWARAEGYLAKGHAQKQAVMTNARWRN